MNESTLDDHTEALFAQYHTPQDLDTGADRWKAVNVKRGRSVHLPHGSDDSMSLSSALEIAEDRDKKTLAYDLSADDELTVVVIEGAVSTATDVDSVEDLQNGEVGMTAELQYDLDLSPLRDRGLWVGVDPRGNHLIVPVRGYEKPDWLDLVESDSDVSGAEEFVHVHEEGCVLFATPDGDESHDECARCVIDELGIDGQGNIPHYDRIGDWFDDWFTASFTELDAELSDSLDATSRYSWVSDFREWHEDQKDQSPNGRISNSKKAHKLTTLLREEYDFIVLEDEATGIEDRPLYIYDPDVGTYQPGGVAFIETRILGELGDLSKSVINAVLYRLRAGDVTEQDDLNAGHMNGRYLCVQNGVIDVGEQTRMPHSPEYKFTTSLDVDYDPDAEAESFQRFLADVVGAPEDKQTLEEWIGFILAMDYPLDRFMILVGEGGNGKSVYLDVLQQFLSAENVSHVPLQKMAGSNRFGLANIENKLVNIDSDTTGGNFYGSTLETLKKATSSGDKLHIERKGESPYAIENMAKFIFAANKPPRLVDETDAIPRRLLWVEFPFQFVDNPTEPNEKQKRPEDELMAELTTEEEMQGILNLALDGLQRLLENGCFSKEQGTDVDERYQNYLMKSDDIAAFGQRYLNRNSDRAVPKKVIFDLYSKRQKQENSRTLNDRDFWPQFDKIHNEFVEYYPDIGVDEQDREYVLRGCDLTEEAAEMLGEPHRDLIRRMYFEASQLDIDDAPHWVFEDANDDESAEDDESDVSEDGMDTVSSISVHDLATHHSGFADITAEVATSPTDTDDGVAECKLMLSDAPIRLSIHTGSDVGNLDAGEVYEFQYLTVAEDENGHVELIAEDIASAAPVDDDPDVMDAADDQDVDEDSDTMSAGQREIQAVIETIDTLQEDSVREPTRDNIGQELRDDMHPETIDRVLSMLAEEDDVNIEDHSDQEVYYV